MERELREAESRKLSPARSRELAGVGGEVLLALPRIPCPPRTALPFQPLPQPLWMGWGALTCYLLGKLAWKPLHVPGWPLPSASWHWYLLALLGDAGAALCLQLR